jgi:hypothetical protein
MIGVTPLEEQDIAIADGKRAAGVRR